MNKLNSENCPLLLAEFIEENQLSRRKVAKAINCSEATIARILARQTLPSDEMIKEVAIMVEIGFQKYLKLSQAEKEKLSETLGAIGGGILGFNAINSAISSFGVVSGLSASGITSGLAGLGSIIGGGMVAGVTVAAAIPVASGVTGYIMIRGAKYFVGEWQQHESALNHRWEIAIADNDQKSLPITIDARGDRFKKTAL